MPQLFSSAGLLYLYIYGYEENEMLYVQQIDTYHYISDNLYNEIMKTAQIASQNENVVHIFAVIGSKNKTNFVFSIIENEMKMNIERIISGKRIKSDTRKLDNVGNVFFHCVQEFYCDQLGHFPKKIYRTYNDIVFGGICCNHINNKKGDTMVDSIVSLWLERENPMICGKQLMTRSFFLQDFNNRKLVATLPNTDTGGWRLVFEGGHQLYLNDEIPYTKETLHPHDLGCFCPSNIQTILLNPIYAYGKLFQPNDICEEWHKVFLYLAAVSDINWTESEICGVYEQFLQFLEAHICLVSNAEHFVSKEKYGAVLLAHIYKFRNFLRGDDELVISKELHYTLNSRYVYLPYIWSLINPKIPICSFFSSVLLERIKMAISEKDIYKKGVLWEDVAEYVLSNIAGWKITGRRIKAGSQEIDLSIANISLDNDLWQLGAYILVECKNWKKHVDVHQIRNIAHISAMKGNKTAILFASNDITSDAKEEIKRLRSSNITIICITVNDLMNLHSAADCKNLIIERWKDLRENFELSTVI